MEPSEASLVLDRFLRQKRWLESPDSTTSISEYGENTVRMELAEILRGAQNELNKYILRHSRGELIRNELVSKLPWSRGFTWDICGDPREFVPSMEMLPELSSISMQSRPPSPLEVLPPIQGHGTHIYPHVWIGELPSRTPEDVLHGISQVPWIISETALATEYLGRQLIVRKDGLVAIESDSPQVAMTDLNHIMAAMLIFGRDVRAVRIREVGQGEINSVEKTIKSWSSTVVSMRTAVPHLRLLKPQIEFHGSLEPDELRLAISYAETVAEDAHLRSFMSFFLEAHTHYQSQEYRQSFVMSWLVIESWLDKTWSDALNERKVSKSRRKRLSEGARFTTEVKSEVLELLGVIDKEQLSKVTRLRRRRNEVVHNGSDPSDSEAEEALEFARQICEGELHKAMAAGETS